MPFSRRVLAWRLSVTDLPPLLFDDDQAVAIAVALQSVASAGVDLEDAAARALSTVRQVMPSRLRHRIDAIRFSGAAAPTTVDPAVLEAVSRAVVDRLTLRFDYSGDDLPPRRTEPHALVARNGRWYLVAWNIDRGEWRSYRVDRIVPKSPGPRFAPRSIPTGDARTFLDARFKGSSQADRWPCYGEFLLDVPAGQIAPRLDDGELEQVTDTTTRVRVGSWSWAELMAWILRFDAPFTIVGPEPFVRASSVFADRIVAAHE